MQKKYTFLYNNVLCGEKKEEEEIVNGTIVHVDEVKGNNYI